LYEGWDDFDGMLFCVICWATWQNNSRPNSWSGPRSRQPFADRAQLTASQALEQAKSWSSISDEELDRILCDSRARVVSSFASADKRTAAASDEVLAEVYEALGEVLPKVFRGKPLSLQSMLSAYISEPSFCAFIMSRYGCSKGQLSTPSGVKLLQQAKVMVPKTGSFGPVADSLPDRAVLSYIHRGLAVGHIVNRGWSEAKRLLEVSRSNLPTNTASAYLMGYCEQACGDWKKGADFGLESISLDPDFKQPYLLVSNCFLQQQQYADAKKASEACLRRHPDAPLAHFNVGQALYHIAVQDGDPNEDLCSQAKQAFSMARNVHGSLWSERDNTFLEYFLEEDPKARCAMKSAPVHTWKVVGWRL